MPYPKFNTNIAYQLQRQKEQRQEEQRKKRRKEEEETNVSNCKNLYAVFNSKALSICHNSDLTTGAWGEHEDRFESCRQQALKQQMELCLRHGASQFKR